MSIITIPKERTYQFVEGAEDRAIQNPEDCQVFVDIQASDRVRNSDETFSDNWYRIPINGVEQWKNKDGPAAINTTTKVTAFNDVLMNEFTFNPDTALVGGPNGPHPDENYTLDTYFDKMLLNRDPDVNSNPFVLARVWMYDEQTESFSVTHKGYVGGYGPTDNSVLRKFWIYDVADLLRDIPVGKVFNNPTVGQLINFTLGGTDDTGQTVGINNTTPFLTSVVSFPSRDELQSRTIEDIQQSVEAETDDDGFISETIDFASEFAVEFFQAEQLVDAVQKPNKTEYYRNRHNLVDVLNDIAKLIDGVWYFDYKNTSPILGGVRLNFRANWSEIDYGRTFVDERTVSSDTSDSLQVQLKENDALSDIKPINTISVNGEASNQLERGVPIQADSIGDLITKVQSGEAFTEDYPFVKLRYDPFYEAAGNVELGPTDVRSDATDIAEAKRDAYEEFFAHIEESTEGRIELFGDPIVEPYDFISAVPACNGTVDSSEVPITYRINDVHHSKYAGEHFTTELGVHANVENGDDNFTIISEIKQAQ